MITPDACLSVPGLRVCVKQEVFPANYLARLYRENMHHRETQYQMCGGRAGGLQTHRILANELEGVLSELDGGANSELEECEFSVKRGERTSANGKHTRAASTYRFRALAPCQKNNWVAAIEWLSPLNEGVCSGN